MLILILAYSITWLVVGIAIGYFWQETRHQEYLWEALSVSQESFGWIATYDLPTQEIPAFGNTVKFSRVL